VLKTLGTQLALFYREPQVRRNLRALSNYVVVLLAIVGAYSVLFQIIMVRIEGQTHSWISGVYWTLVTMSTLGFGDITFQTDLGRGFSVLVLFSGVILLLIVLPFAFISYLYAPWLQAQLRLRAPRELPPETQDHVILCDYDAVAESVIEQFDLIWDSLRHPRARSGARQPPPRGRASDRVGRARRRTVVGTDAGGGGPPRRGEPR